ncbi:MAG TPA: bifunctional precorrin-2 dehydrogenase/sirohydrochlorin ferrochelatase [Spirochaetota bacterium]|nr:bifunctional precorrin-2 dehydrogenase/sirohydrochlorin ferrochelatase [Spirochaetota bacterium]HQO39553.1 bifunctional precorrin-2 dehydrogenase/sirohydrochlorin ferrochelatase [Spirochaetota bacterium]
MKLYPVMINMTGKSAVIIGGGEVAARKLGDLLDSGARVKVVSPVFNDEIIAAAGEFPLSVELVNRKYIKGDLDSAMMVFSATNDPEVNHEVFLEAESANILINAVDDPPNCSFYVPSFVRRGDLLFSLSTGGASPAMAARLRRELEIHIPENIDLLLEKLKIARDLLKSHNTFSRVASPERGGIMKRIVSDDRLLHTLSACKDEDEIIRFLLLLV